jgi:hypothetical protein
MAGSIIPSSSGNGTAVTSKLGRLNAAVERSWFGRRFRLAARGTTFTTELRAGTTTFLTMAYILAVNATILSDWRDVQRRRLCLAVPVVQVPSGGPRVRGVRVPRPARPDRGDGGVVGDRVLHHGRLREPPHRAGPGVG